MKKTHKKTTRSLPKIKEESDSRHPLSFEAVQAAAKQIRGPRYIQTNCTEHPVLLARFFLYGEIIPSSAKASTLADYPYQRNFAVEEINYKSGLTHFVIVERDNILLRDTDSKIIPYLPTQFSAIPVEGDYKLVENKETYQSTYCSVAELPKKLEKMAGARGWVGAVISLSRLKKCKNEEEALTLCKLYQQEPGKFDQEQQGHLIFVYHFTQKLNQSLPRKRQVADDKRTFFIELGNINRGKEEAPCVAYSIAGLGLRLTDDPKLYKKPRLLSKGDYFFSKMTVTPLRDIKPTPAHNITVSSSVSVSPISSSEISLSVMNTVTVPSISVPVNLSQSVTYSTAILPTTTISLNTMVITTVSTPSVASAADYPISLAQIIVDKNLTLYTDSNGNLILTNLHQEFLLDPENAILFRKAKTGDELAHYAMTHDYSHCNGPFRLISVYFYIMGDKAELALPAIFRQLSTQQQFAFTHTCVNGLGYLGQKELLEVLKILGKQGLLDPLWQKICHFGALKTNHLPIYFIGKMLASVRKLLVEILLTRFGKPLLKLSAMKIAPPDSLHPKNSHLEKPDCLGRSLPLSASGNYPVKVTIYSAIKFQYEYGCKHGAFELENMQLYLSHWQQEAQKMLNTVRDDFALAFNPQLKCKKNRKVLILKLALRQDIGKFLGLFELLCIATLANPKKLPISNLRKRQFYSVALSNSQVIILRKNGHNNATNQQNKATRRNFNSYIPKAADI